MSDFAEFVISVLRRAKTRSRDLEEICRPSVVYLRWRENSQTVADAKGHDSSKHCQEYEKKHVRGQMFWLAIKEFRRFGFVLHVFFALRADWSHGFPSFTLTSYMFSRAKHWLVTYFSALCTDWLHLFPRFALTGYIFSRASHWLVTCFPALCTD